MNPISFGPEMSCHSLPLGCLWQYCPHSHMEGLLFCLSVPTNTPRGQLLLPPLPPWRVTRLPFCHCKYPLRGMTYFVLCSYLKVYLSTLWGWVNCSIYIVKAIGNFQVAFRLCFKASPSAKPFIWKLVLFTCRFWFICMWIKLISIWKASH